MVVTIIFIIDIAIFLSTGVLTRLNATHRFAPSKDLTVAGMVIMTMTAGIALVLRSAILVDMHCGPALWVLDGLLAGMLILAMVIAGATLFCD